MTRGPEVIEQSLELAARGYNASQIARELGVPRRTVADWIAGRVPRGRTNAASCPTCGGQHRAHADLPDVYVYLLGLYLGDGYVAPHPRGVHRLRVTLDKAYPEIIAECAAAMRAIMPRNPVGQLRRKGDIEVYSYSKGWPCLLPQHGPGKKHTRRIVLEPWQEALVARRPELLVRGLIQSDGCRFINTGRNWRHARYAFYNHSADIRGIFCDVCDRLGLHWTTAAGRGLGRTVYVSAKADVARLDEWVGPKR